MSNKVGPRGPMGNNYWYDATANRHYMLINVHTHGSGLYRCREDGRYYVLTDEDMSGMQLAFLPAMCAQNDWAMYEMDRREASNKRRRDVAEGIGNVR